MRFIVTNILRSLIAACLDVSQGSRDRWYSIDQVCPGVKCSALSSGGDSILLCNCIKYSCLFTDLFMSMMDAERADASIIKLYCTQNLEEHQEENPAHNQESGYNVHHRHITG